MDWNQNPEWRTLPALELGDLATIRATDTFVYTFRVKITQIDGDQITGIVEAVFDYGSGAEILGGKVVQENIGKPISLNKNNIYNIIKAR